MCLYQKNFILMHLLCCETFEPFAQCDNKNNKNYALNINLCRQFSTPRIYIKLNFLTFSLVNFAEYDLIKYFQF